MSYVGVRNVIPDPARRQVRELRRLLFDMAHRPGFVVLRVPLLGELIASATPTQQPPVLVVSLPRGGSSWVGSILARAEDTLYLREPITQSYARLVGKGTRPVFSPEICKDLRSYDRFASRAFNGLPRFGGKIVHDPSQWTLFGRSRKRVVIKEVNPLAIERWYSAFRPKIIYLLRHPAAVIRSHRALGWRAPGGSNGNGGFGWEDGGAFQAAIQNRTLECLRALDHIVVRYEDLCVNPLGEFTRIFEYSGLHLSAAVQHEIECSSSSETDYVPGQYDTVRNSRQMKDQWKLDLEPKHVELIRRGYLANRPSFYAEASDW